MLALSHAVVLALATLLCLLLTVEERKEEEGREEGVLLYVYRVYQ